MVTETVTVAGPGICQEKRTPFFLNGNASRQTKITQVRMNLSDYRMRKIESGVSVLLVGFHHSEGGHIDDAT